MTDVKHAAIFGAGSAVYYSVGCHVACYDQRANEMSFLHGNNQVSSIGALAISPNKKYLACVERSRSGGGRQGRLLCRKLQFSTCSWEREPERSLPTKRSLKPPLFWTYASGELKT
eukprot:evm.model.scf_890.6 EVM.evm.TU.scf_890.6   scf_890:28780-30995(-)